MYQKKHIIQTAAITFFITTVFYLTFGSNMLFSIVAGSKSQTISKLSRLEKLVDDNYIGEIDKKIMEDYALTGYMAGVGDDYTAYITPAEFDSYETMIEGDYGGIGIEVYISDDNLITVITPFDGSPAAKAGILAGDKIVKINGKTVGAANYTDAISMIRGETDGSVNLTLKRGDEELTIDVNREKITMVNVKSRMIDDIGYIRISSFDGHADEQFSAAVDEIMENNAKGLVIDVRNNPGGTLDSVTKIAERVLKEGKILTVKVKSGKETVYKATKSDEITLPMCVLVNSSTASAAEVLASSLHDNGKAEVIGVKTFGKGVVQSVYQFGDGSAAKITTAKYYTPAGECIDKIGITPDMIVELPEEIKSKNPADLDVEEDTQLATAIEKLTK